MRTVAGIAGSLPRAPATCVRMIGAMDGRPIGVFDSGVGGLTVLHELPRDAAARGRRLPRRQRAAPVRAAAARRDPAASRSRSAGTSRREGVKLVVVACNSATAAALPDLQRALAVPVLGVLQPEAHARRPRDAKPPRRPARDRGDRRERALRGARPRARRGRRGRLGRRARGSCR